MHNRWKLATLGLVALGAIVGTSSLTTAYLRRPPATAPEMTPPTVTQVAEHRPPIVRVAATRKPVTPVRPRVVSAVAEAPATAAGDREPIAVAESAPAVPPTLDTAAAGAPAATTVAQTPSTTPRPVDCDTGGDRALRIAKPGAIGALLGAGLGATGGAIAKGGKGAGQGALIGGLAGAVLGAGYGAYKTRNECGTILGDDRSRAGGRLAPASGSLPPHAPTREDAMAPLQSGRPSAERIQIYDAR